METLNRKNLLYKKSQFKNFQFYFVKLSLKIDFFINYFS